MANNIVIHVYGAEMVCASCVNLPSSKETFSWLEAALSRKYGNQIQLKYVDIYVPIGENEKLFSQRVIEEDLWYPVIVIEDEIIDEGNPKLKNIYAKLDSLGVELV